MKNLKENKNKYKLEMMPWKLPEIKKKLKLKY